jgi:hypothetical protein
MSHRLIATLIAVLGTAAVCHAEPLRWGWTLTSPAGEVYGSGSGLTPDMYREYGYYPVFGLPTPELPLGPATRADVSWFPDVHVKVATTFGTLTLTDEASNAAVAFDVFYTRKESWRLTTHPDGTTTAEVEDSWDEYGPHQPSALGRAGRLLFEVSQEDQYSKVYVTAIETPEPGTLILGGIALAGGVGAWWRKRTG